MPLRGAACREVHCPRSIACLNTGQPWRRYAGCAQGTRKRSHTVSFTAAPPTDEPACSSCAVQAALKDNARGSPTPAQLPCLKPYVRCCSPSRAPWLAGQRSLTCRSTGPPTACRPGRVAVWFIICLAARAPHRRRPVNSALGITLNSSRCAPWTCILALLLTASVHASPKCILPVPDGSDEQPTSPNLEGVIASVRGKEVVVRVARTGKLVAVRLTEEPQIYTVFGGVARIADLRSSQSVSVWFKNCSPSPIGAPLVAYLQIYSTDPRDKPREPQSERRSPG